MGGLDRLMEMLCNQWYVDVAAVHAAMAIYIWFGLLWRPSLSMPHALFEFCRRGKGIGVAHRTELWCEFCRRGKGIGAEMLRGKESMGEEEASDTILPAECC